MNEKMSLTEALDSSKIRFYRTAVLKRLRKRLKSIGHEISDDDLCSEVDYTAVMLYSSFKHSEDGVSFTTYFFKWAEKYTWWRIINLNRKTIFDVVLDLEQEYDDFLLRNHGRMSEFTIDEYEKIERRDLVFEVLRMCSPEERELCEKIMLGFSMNEISESMKINRRRICRIIEKIRRKVK